MQLHLKKFTTILLAGLILTGCGSAPVKLTGNEPLTVKDFVEVDNDFKLTGIKRVAIPNFFVQFVRDETIELHGKRLEESYTVQTRGVSDTTLQKVADQLYADFVGELKAVGIEVMPIPEMDINADFQTIRKEARKSPTIEEANTGGVKGKNTKLQGVSILTSAKGLPINLAQTIDKRWLTPSVGDGFKVALNRSSGMLSRTMKIPLLNVRMTISMIAQQGTAYNNSLKFKADPYPRFVEEGTLITLITDDDNNKFSLNKPIVIKDINFTGEEGSGASARGAGLFGALGRAIGGPKNMEADLYFDIDAENFAARVSARGKEVSHLLVEAMSK